MNLRLILLLSLFGLAMALGSVFLIPAALEPIIWLAIFLFCAWIIANNYSGNYFMFGFLLSIFNSVWIITIHSIFYGDYIFRHLDQAEILDHLPLHNSPRLMIVLVDLVMSLISGLILGLFSLAAARIVKKRDRK